MYFLFSQGAGNVDLYDETMFNNQVILIDFAKTEDNMLLS